MTSSSAISSAANPPSSEKVDAAVARTAFQDDKPKDDKPKEMAKPSRSRSSTLDLEDVNLDKSEIRGVDRAIRWSTCRSFQRDTCRSASLAQA